MISIHASSILFYLIFEDYQFDTISIFESSIAFIIAYDPISHEQDTLKSFFLSVAAMSYETYTAFSFQLLATSISCN